MVAASGSKPKVKQGMALRNTFLGWRFTSSRVNNPRIYLYFLDHLDSRLCPLSSLSAYQPNVSL